MTNKNSDKSRYYHILTYCSEAQLRIIFGEHSTAIRSFCYINHNRDIKDDGQIIEPHFHVAIRLFNAQKINTIKNWFKDLIDENGKHINSFPQIVYSRSDLAEYLLHYHDGEPISSKVQYEEADLKGNVQDCLSFIKNSNIASDIVEDMLNEASILSLVYQYGSEFVHNYKSYSAIYNELTYKDSVEAFKKNQTKK